MSRKKEIYMYRKFCLNYFHISLETLDCSTRLPSGLMMVVDSEISQVIVFGSQG